MLVAHSADKKRSISEQSYAAHVGGVVTLSMKAAKAASQYAIQDGILLEDVVQKSAEFHDLGKLDEDNQQVLSGKRKAKSLPVQHAEAGTAYLLNEQNNAIAATLVRSHHIGMPDFVEESNRGDELLRDSSVSSRIDDTLSQLLFKHRADIYKFQNKTEAAIEMKGDPSVFFRIALSCLADGDHTDTAIHYQDYPVTEPESFLKPEQRLAALDAYVAKLGDNSARSQLRSAVYSACRNANVDVPISACDSPVGTGKTTAVMAHLLTQAANRKLRRIIVVLPFTNIITQSVEVYRKALVLPGENPEEVVAELHHRADFKSISSRHLTALWKAPIIVTTAVNFFETLASNTPSTLRRLHNLPGSAIFVDESHAALPAKLLPLAWYWMKIFANEWNCYWVLASGSLNRFWKIPEFDKELPDIPEIMPKEMRSQLGVYEKTRVTFKYSQETMSAIQLASWVETLPGPRIVILNTVQSAAAVALEYSRKFGREKVEHLSTALSPTDRSKTLEGVKKRLKNKKDTNWTFIATSCVEAGVDLSFRTGVRELASLVSLLQIAGRVNRHGGIADAEVWSVKLAEGALLKLHPGFQDSAIVLKEFFDQGKIITPELCTEALKREIRRSDAEAKFREKLFENEQTMRFPQVEKSFSVISSDTRTVIVDTMLVDRLENFEKVNWRDLQQGSVQIWGYRIEALRIPTVNGREDLYRWHLAYDDFIGYMAGVFTLEEVNQGGFIAI